MKISPAAGRYAICVQNGEHPASLEVRKIYRIIDDAQAEKHLMLRVVDESGEDYLYPTAWFVPLELPQAAEGAFSLAS